MGDGGLFQIGAVGVVTTNGRGFTAEEWAERCLRHIVYVADESESPIQAQAQAFKEDIRKVLIAYMKKAIQSDRTTLYHLLLERGEQEMAELIQKL